MSETKDNTGVIEAFHLMYDHYPESVMLIRGDRTIVAVNPVAQAQGRAVGSRCVMIEPKLSHRGCKAAEALKTGKASYRKRQGKLGDVVSFWLPVSGWPDYLVHFSVGGTVAYRYTTDPLV